jgi:carbamoyltransferase
MKILGINALNHDASVSIVSKEGIEFWRRSSELTGVKGDELLNQQLVDMSLDYDPALITWYERPLIKKTRQARAGQWSEVWDMSQMPTKYLKTFGVNLHIKYIDHHLSHASAGWYLSPYSSAAIVVADAIGEWTTTSIWQAQLGQRPKLLWRDSYPHSMGLFYSAFTKLIGHRPASEEHLLQRLSEQGDSDRYYALVKSYLDKNLHRGVWDWPYPVTEPDRADIAAAVQRVFEEEMLGIMLRAQGLTSSKALVYMGGCSMNSLFNAKLADIWSSAWSLKIPGDAASSFGSALAYLNCKVPPGELGRILV